MAPPFPKKEPITKVVNGNTYYCIITPQDGFTERKAEELRKKLIDEDGYRDCLIEKVRGFYYVYGDPGVTVEEVQKQINKFALIENGQRIIEKFQWATFREIPTEKWFYVECHNCGYQWKTQSQMNLVTCPSCGFKTPRHLQGGVLAAEER